MTRAKKDKKVWYRRMWIYIVGAIVIGILMYLGIQGVRCAIAVRNAREKAWRFTEQ